jgi:carboxymethylenebutenolidase
MMNYFQRYLAEEFAEDYQEGRISRRKALKLIVSVTGSVLVANTLLAACNPVDGATPPHTLSAPTQAGETPQPAAATGTPLPASTQAPVGVTPTQPAASETPAGAASTAGGSQYSNATVVPGDPAVQAGDAQFPGADGATLLGYLARPAGAASSPVVLVCHENRGLTDYIRDVTRRLAKAGYVGLAVDLLSRQGGTAKLTPDAVPGALGGIPPDQFAQDFRSGWEYLKTQTYAQAERVGMVGFCFGGGVTWVVATRMPELRAAVPFYGPQPPVADVPGIQAAVLAIYGEKDTRIDAGIPAIEEAMQKNNKVFEKVIYPNADHAFHNDTGTRFNPQAAQDAWSRTLEWFAKYLGA